MATTNSTAVIHTHISSLSLFKSGSFIIICKYIIYIYILPCPFLLPILFLLSICDFLLVFVCLTFSTCFFLKRLPEIWFYPESIFPNWLISSGVYISLFDSENVHEKLLTFSILKNSTYKHSFISQHCHTMVEKEDLYKIYIADGDFPVLCALHYIFSLNHWVIIFWKNFVFLGGGWKSCLRDDLLSE